MTTCRNKQIFPFEIALDSGKDIGNKASEALRKAVADANKGPLSATDVRENGHMVDALLRKAFQKAN